MYCVNTLYINTVNTNFTAIILETYMCNSISTPQKGSVNSWMRLLGSKTFGNCLGTDAFLGLQLGVYPADPSWRVRLHDPKIFNGHATPHQVSSRRPWDSIWESETFSENPRRPEISTKKRWIPIDLTCTFLQLHHHFWCGKKILDSEDVFFGEKSGR